ncbi:Alg9-like mannosyltransferase family-domain-containing protein [Geopyxis carbonaria]|nr:Alg9-like mannosyltransferase family-domain-containing protein [Geopyxis carbonaria]
MAEPTTSTHSSRRLYAFSIHSTIFLFLLSFRILNALTVRTFFQPDEYFQSLEPAWHMVFGEGWLTWEWRHGLRSIAHPAVFAGLYKTLNYVHNVLNISPAQQEEIYVAAPKVLQAVFATMGDWATARMAGVLWGSEVGWVALALSTGSAWQWFCATRTFANSLETAITAVALSVWPWNWAAGAKSEHQRGELRLSLLLAAFACILRPTNILVWSMLGAFAVGNNKGRRRSILIWEAAWIGASLFGLNALADHAYYGEWTFPPITFLKFNVIHSLSAFYGRNDWHYYLSQGLPLLLTAFLPISLYAIYTSLRTLRVRSPSFQIATTITFVTAVYSLIAHKEVRFIYPLLPMLHALTAKSLQRTSWSKKTRNRVLWSMVALNLPIAYYGAYVHQRGVIDVMDHLRNTKNTWRTAGFLMPCHSTPWSSSLGLPGTSSNMWALGCEPPIGMSPDEQETYIDEADLFYKDPSEFMKGEPMAKHGWPDRLIFFGQLEKTVQEIVGNKYVPCFRTFNTHFHDDSRRVGDVIMFCKTEKAEERSSLDDE